MSQSPNIPIAPAPSVSTWTVAEQAVQQLCGGKGNFNHLWQLIQSLCALGLADLVEPVLDTIKLDAPAWLAQRAAVLEQARKLAGGKISWESRAKIFSDNIDALSEANAALENLRGFWGEHRDRYALFCANDGNFQVVDQREPVVFAGFVGGLIDHRALTRFWTYKCVGYQLPRPIAFDGAGYGWVLGRVLESTQRTLHNFSCAVYVVEPDLASACILLNLQDLRPWRHRLRMFAGSTAQADFEAALDAHSNWDLPATMVGERIDPRPALDLEASTRTATQKRAERDSARSVEIQDYYGRITLDEWATRFEEASQGRRRLKVLGMTSRYTTVLQYSMEELGAAVRAAGHEFVFCKEPDDQCANVAEVQVIAQHKPDLLMTISRLRSENPRLPRNVPALCWDQDNLPCMRTEAARKALDAFTYVAGAGAWQGYEQLDWPRQNCILAFLAAATHRYHNEPANEALMAKHRCTFSYTSNASGSPESLVEELRRGYAKDSRVRALFDRVVTEVLARAKNGYAWDSARIAILLDGFIQADNRPIPPAARSEIIMHLRSISDRAFRHLALGWVAEYCEKKNKTLRLYGKGWETNPRFAKFAAGFLEPGEELRAVYQASEINLQIIETGFLHSRALDGLAAGGFFLYRLAPETRDLDGTEAARVIMTQRALETECLTYGQLDASTDPLIVGAWAYARSVIRLGKPDERCRMLDIWSAAPSEERQVPHLDEITFEGQAQFNEMTDRYLGDAELRQSVAGRLREVVVERFSYDARWGQFVSGIARGLRSAADEAISSVRAMEAEHKAA